MAAPLVVAGGDDDRDLTPHQRRGKAIYLEGKDPEGGEIVALMGDPAVEVPAAAMPCAGCHGPDGKGRPEGGSSPSDLTWPVLTKSYGTTRSRGEREHPPYDARLVKRAFTMGIDPAGNRLAPLMPRYRLSREAADALVAYLRGIHLDHDPGVDEERLHLGTLLPPMPEAAAAVDALLRAWVQKLNEEGGLYGRHLELSTAAPVGEPAERRRQAAAFLEEAEPFALVAPYLAGAEEELAGLLEEHGIPAVGATALHPEDDGAGRYVFYLFPGVGGEAAALARWWARDYPGTSLLLIHPQSGPLAAAARSARRWAEEAGLAVTLITWEEGAFDAARLVRLGVDLEGPAALVLGPETALRELLAAARDRGWDPAVLAPGTLTGGAVREAAEGFGGRLALAFPTLPTDRTPEGVERHRALTEAAGSSSSYPAAQTAALAAARLMAEALQRAGRNLSRAGLVEELEGLYRYQSGLAPPFTLGPNRRIASAGAWVLEVDPATGDVLPDIVWVDLPDGRH